MSAIARPAAWALAALVLSPWIYRALLLVDRVGGVGAGDLRGFASDLAVSALAAAALLALARASRALALLFSALWVAAHTINHETVHVLGALAPLAEVSYLGDATFVLGSGTALSRPLWAGLLFVASMAMAWPALQVGAWRPAAALVLAAALGLAGLGLWPIAGETALWRQADFLHQGGRRVLLRLASSNPERGGRGADPASAMIGLVPELAADLDGEPRVPLPGRARNVLLVVLESVSGAHVASFAAKQGQPATAEMPELDRVAERGLRFGAFVDQQRKTNRGMYAILCGELPSLAAGFPKMSAYLEGGRRCLPELLADAGFTTAYLQAAPLAFMLKDQFMPRVGFGRVEGQEAVERYYARSHWGVDDRAFFERASDVIAALRAEDAPWFATLLTVGTHHPYVFPEDFAADAASLRDASLAYLDLALGEFVARLDEAGALDDTLVIFTSDESSGFDDYRQSVTSRLSQNWGFLLVLTPEGLAGDVVEPWAQTDVALSILDYTGNADGAGHLFGRSLFRRYDAARSIFFANTNLDMTGSLDPFGRLLLCRDEFRSCLAYQTRPGMPFGAQRKPVEVDPLQREVLRELTARSLVAEEAASGRRDFDLVAAPIFAVEGTEKQLILGAQDIDLDAGDGVEVELEVAVRGDFEEALLLFRIVSYERSDLHFDLLRVRPGQTLRLGYRYAPDAPERGVQCQAFIKIERGRAAELDFASALLRLRRGDAAPAPAVEVVRRELDGEPVVPLETHTRLVPSPPT